MYGFGRPSDMADKVKITQKEFDDIYQIEEITEDIPDVAAKQEDTTPEFLTKEQEEQDESLFDDLPDMEDTQP